MHVAIICAGSRPNHSELQLLGTLSMVCKKSKLKPKSNGECNDHEVKDSIPQQVC